MRDDFPMRLATIFFAAVGFFSLTRVAAGGEPSPDAAARIEFEVAENIPDAAYPFVSKYRTVWLGEMHGTNEAPRLFLGLVRLMSRHAAKPVVALEIPVWDQPAIDEFLRTGDGASLKTKSFFKWPGDGRSSRAMYALLTALRTERVATVVCFDPGMHDEKTPRDEGMALNLASAAEKFPDSKLVVLSGSIHSRIAQGAQWDPDLRPAAFELAKRIGPVAAFQLTYESGTIWAIMDDDQKGREHTVGGSTVNTNAPFFLSRLAELKNGHNGVIYSRTVTASPPQFENDAPLPPPTKEKSK